MDGGNLEFETTHAPVDRMLEAADGQAELAAWLDDAWSTRLIRYWEERDVAVRVAPTAGAILHPVYL